MRGARPGKGARAAQPPPEVRAARLRFLVVFGLLGFALVTLYSYPFPDTPLSRGIIIPYFEAYARAVGAILKLFDPTVSVSGIQISGRFSIMIVRSCDAGETMALLVAAVLAFPAGWLRRLLGLAVGLAAVFAINVIRICSLYLIGATRPELFDLAHRDISPALVVGLAALVFLAWASWARRGEHAGAAAAATA